MTPTYSLAWLLQEYSQNTDLAYVFFWGHKPTSDGSLSKSVFSQWWFADFVVDNVLYPTAEHYMMAQKALLFDDQEVFKQIIETKLPADAKKLGRKVRNFDNEVWLEKRYQIVVEANYHKFSQNPDLQLFLCQTGNKVLVEASPVDSIWGIGLSQQTQNIENPLTWKGLNLLGFALMEVRDRCCS